MTMTTRQLKQKVIKRFDVQFSAAPDAVILAPERVNLIGEYTDLNNGFVLLIAIYRYLAMALKKRNDNRVKIHSIDFIEMIDLDHLEKRKGSFQEYRDADETLLTQTRKNIQKKPGLHPGFMSVIRQKASH